jgi:amidohydrolase
MVGADSFHARIKGQGSHGAMPHLGHDPVLTAAHGIIALQSVVSRNLNPLDAAVISVTQMQAGSAVNIIPDDVTLGGTIRTFSTSTREAILGRVQQILEGTAHTMNCALELTFEQLSRPVINDTGIANHLAEVVQTSWPDLICHRDFRTLAAEDIAYFLERVPGVFFFVGSANAGRGLNFPHHHPRFDFDEEALVTGAALLAAAVTSYTQTGK